MRNKSKPGRPQSSFKFLYNFILLPLYKNEVIVCIIWNYYLISIFVEFLLELLVFSKIQRFQFSELVSHMNVPKFVQPKNKVPLKWFIWEPRELLNFLSALSKTFLIAHTFSIYSSTIIFPSNLCFSLVIISSIFYFHDFLKSQFPLTFHTLFICSIQ